MSDLFQEVKEEMNSFIFKQKLHERLWKIEGVMNELKNYHGLSRAKFRGIKKIQIQAYFAAIAINIKRIIYFLAFECLMQIITIFYNRPVCYHAQTLM